MPYHELGALQAICACIFLIFLIITITLTSFLDITALGLDVVEAYP